MTAAPYKRFRPVADGAPDGTFTADLHGCSWSCAGCWSRSGDRRAPAAMFLTPDEVADKLAAGLAEHHLTTARIGYGEPGEHWPHVAAATERFVARVPAPAGIVIETNGAALTPQRIDALDHGCGAGAARVTLDIGIKATTAQQLADLTGRADAAEIHQAQLHAILHTAWVSERLGLRVTFLDEYSDPGIVAELAHQLEVARRGRSAGVRVLDYQQRP